jgi:hypothetical protein
MLKHKIAAGLLPLLLAVAGSAQAGQGGSYYNPSYDEDGGCNAAQTNDQDWYINNNWYVPAMENGESVTVLSEAYWYNGSPVQGYYATFECNNGTITTYDVYYYEPAYAPYWSQP